MEETKNMARSGGRAGIRLDFIRATYPCRGELVAYYLRGKRYDELKEALARADRMAAPAVKEYNGLLSEGDPDEDGRINQLRKVIGACYTAAKVDPTYTGATFVNLRAG